MSCSVSHVSCWWCRLQHAIEDNRSLRESVQQGCTTSDFLLTMVCDPIFWWIHDTALPNGHSLPTGLPPSACTFADDFKVTSRSFSELMSRMVHAFAMAAPHGSQSCESLHEPVVTHCAGFLEMKVVRHAKYFVTMIGPEGFANWRTPPRNTLFQIASAIAEYPRSLTQKLVAFKMFSLSVLGYIGSLAAPRQGYL